MVIKKKVVKKVVHKVNNILKTPEEIISLLEKNMWSLCKDECIILPSK